MRYARIPPRIFPILCWLNNRASYLLHTRQRECRLPYMICYAANRGKQRKRILRHGGMKVLWLVCDCVGVPGIPGFPNTRLGYWTGDKKTLGVESIQREGSDCVSQLDLWEFCVPTELRVLKELRAQKKFVFARVSYLSTKTSRFNYYLLQAKLRLYDM